MFARSVRRLFSIGAKHDVWVHLIWIFAAALSSACAPLQQKPNITPVAFSGPRIDGDALISFDGARLGLRIWPAQGETKAVLIGLHGMNDYSAGYRTIAPFLAERGVTVYALDQRGFGRSPNPGLWPGEDLLVEDAAAFEQAVRAENPGKPLAMMGISMGGAVAIRASARGRIHPDRLILAAPAVWGWSSMPKSYRAALWLAAHTGPSQYLTPPKNLKIVASDNNKVLWENWKDPLFLKKTRVDSVYGLVSLMENAANSIGALPVQTLYLYGAHDQIIPPKATFRALRKLPAGVRTIYYPKGYHLLTSDLQAAVVWSDIFSFIQDISAPPPSGLGTIQAMIPATKPILKRPAAGAVAESAAAQGNP